MTYCLDPAIPMSDALRRVALAELEYAQSALSAASDRHGGVHSARKCLKRLRALLALIRPGLPEPVFANLSEKLRSIALGLAPARDAHALIDAIDKLVADASSEPDMAPIHSLRGWLSKRRQAAERNLEGRAASEATRGLAELKPAFAGLAVYPDNFHSVAEGLRLRYRATRKAFGLAFATGTDKDFHDWRKGVQHHWRHMQLLAPCWPSELTARVEAARSLSQLLGDDHDIALLRQLVSTPTMVFGSLEDTALFLKRCRRRQKALRREAKAQGERLFVERSRPFVERIEAYWLAVAEGAATPIVAATALEERRADERGDNVVPFDELRSTRAS
jgi:CHAD domain-containing protein